MIVKEVRGPYPEALLIPLAPTSGAREMVRAGQCSRVLGLPAKCKGRKTGAGPTTMTRQLMAPG